MLHIAAAPAALLDDDRIARLGSDGYFLVDGLLGVDGARALRGEVIELARAGALRPAAIGRGANQHLERASRGDEIAWLDPASAPAGLRAWLAALERLRDELNATVWLGLRRYEVQAARYVGGAGYVRHLDAFPGGPNRQLTAIYYLNEGWAPGHGGLLRIFPGVGPPVEVEPLLDRLVIFLSSRLEHEVTPSWAERLALTAWFYGREDLPP